MGYLEENRDSKAKNMLSVTICLYTYLYEEVCLSFPKVAITAHFPTLKVKNQKHL